MGTQIASVSIVNNTAMNSRKQTIQFKNGHKT